ncbi:MAG: hypothetical protein L3J04_04170 [Robiginitomaculum sp.]|nr:hypothetical protein [Robiginitomaculum sp.]
MRSPLYLALASVLVLGACATATPYQSAENNNRGFSEQQIEKDRFRVSFAGNSVTNLSTVENYLLYRAAELTTQRGFDYFIIAEREVDKKQRVVGTSYYGVGHGHFGWNYYSRGHGWGYSAGYGHGFGGRYGFGRGFYGGGFGSGYDLRQITSYEAFAEITMGLGAKPADNERAYDAADVMRNLAGEIKRPQQ